MRVGIIVLLIFFGFSATGQPVEEVNLLTPQFGLQLTSFVSSIKNQNNKSELSVLKSLSAKAHRKFLKKYAPYSQVSDVFEKGNYDCLSGTYFMCAALGQLGYRYRIIETNYHIFLLVETQDQEILLESTDRFNGLVSNPQIIDEKIAGYRQSQSEVSSKLYLSGLNLFHELKSYQLPGLLYYNQAVDAFHKNNLSACCQYLQQAWKIYDNIRIEQFMPILMNSILASNLDETKKLELIDLLQTRRNQTAIATASR